MANDYVNNLMGKTNQQMGSTSNSRSPPKGGQSIQTGNSPNNMYNINPNNPTVDAFDDNDQFRKSSQLLRKPGQQQQSDSSNYQFPETESDVNTFRKPTESGPSARVKESSED